MYPESQPLPAECRAIAALRQAAQFQESSSDCFS
jgi:hypothetical protein